MTTLRLAVSLILTIPGAGPESAPPGRRIGLEVEGATLFVPDGYRPASGGVVDVVLHLHGAGSVVEPALIDTRWPAVLLTFNRKGLSRVYAEPFADPAFFPRLLDAARSALGDLHVANDPRFGRVVVSSFSAGFGGVRAMLKVPEHFARIDGLVMADSIYCGYTGEANGHRVDPALMDGFRRFAVEAAAGRKAFLLSHSALVPEGYASTAETADFLIDAMDGNPQPTRIAWAEDWVQTRTFSRGRFLVLGFAGTQGADHMNHLRRINLLWKQFLALPAERAGAGEGRLADELAALRPKDVSAAENAVLDHLEQRADRALAAIPRARSRIEAERARPGLRRKLVHSLGLSHLPWPPELRPRIVGTLPRPGYRIEKIVYQALPGMLVPAHLYLPEGRTGRAPAVLFYPGHWWADSKVRPDFQAFCINMARLGFVALSFDPFGQGERGVSSRDHRRTEALLVGVAQQGIAEYETRCALEYLRSRSEVDPDRIGITGASGGGYNTWITAALDDRIAAAVPVVGTSEFAEQIRVCRPLDWYQAAEHCHFVPGLIGYANNHELLAMAAPRPLLIVAADRDQSFPVEGVRAVAEYGRGLYDSSGASDRIALVVDRSEGHGYQQKKREAAYGWFLRWLAGRGDGGPFPEPPTETPSFDTPELRCFPLGQNQQAGPAIVAMVQRLARDLPPNSPRKPIDLESVLGPWPRPRPRGQPEPDSQRLRVERIRLQRLSIPTEPGISLPAFLLRPPGEPRGVLVALDDRGKEALGSDPVVLEAFERNWAVCGVDPRGIGESATTRTGWVFAVSLLLGENFVGRQAFDLSRAFQELEATGAFPDKPVGLYARGPNSSLIATYTLADDASGGSGQSRLNWFLLRDGFLSFRAFFERPQALRESFRLMPADGNRTTSFDREIPASFFVFDVLRSWDLPQLLASTSAQGLIVNPIDGDRNRLPAHEAEKLLPRRTRVVSAVEPGPSMRAFLRSILEDRRDEGR